jgi:hypothetical protein
MPGLNRAAARTALLLALALGAVPGLAAPPDYRPGDTYIYSDRRVETALRIEANDVIWRAGNGQRFIRPRNFVVPAIEWSTNRTRGRRVVRGNHAALWPLEAGRTVRFRAMAEVRSDELPLRRIPELWTCTAMGQKRIEVPAGRFDTQQIRCDRYSPDTMRVQRRVTWYYSPDVGHYVRRETFEFRNGQRSSVDLVAQLHGREANSAAIRSILAGLKKPQRAAE